MTDLILFNANVITMDPANPVAELVAVEAGRISFVGSNEMLRVLKDRGARAIDCAGRTLMPGFIDAHCHVRAYAEFLMSLNFSKAETHLIQDIQSKIWKACNRLPEGNWIRAKGYNEHDLYEKRHPTRWDLDAAAPRHPVKLTHRSGHAHVLNSLALEKVGIHDKTGDPPEGFIDRDLNTGTPTGILYGMGGYLAGRIPALDESELDSGVELVNKKLLSLGITSIQDASYGNGPEQWKRFERWKRREVFTPRVTMMMGLNAFIYPGPKTYDSVIIKDHLKLGAVKIIADEVTGTLHPTQKDLNETITLVQAAGRQAAIHAIEEPVIEAAANSIEFAAKKRLVVDHRHRIEHCSVCSPQLLQRLAKLGAVVVTQPSFIYYSGDRYLETVPPDQLNHLYSIESMHRIGLCIGFGSDFPISDPSPLISIHSAVTRRTEGDSVLPQSGIAVLEAFRLHTLGSARANFEENTKGSLVCGNLADIILLSENPLTMNPARIKDTHVIMTVIDGQVVSKFDSRFHES